jgi:exosome complex component CSL4
MKEQKQTALPGDTVALPEEFVPGKHVYENENSIRALLAGTVLKDFSKREVHVRPVTRNRMPSVGDYVTGQVEAVQANSAGLRVYYLNGKPTGSGFTGMLLLRAEGGGGRGRRRTTPVKLGDIVRAKVASLLNGIIQLSIDEDRTGVFFALCSVCGSPLTRADGRAKCLECGNVEERKFASDFGKEPIQP